MNQLDLICIQEKKGQLPPAYRKLILLTNSTFPATDHLQLGILSNLPYYIQLIISFVSSCLIFPNFLQTYLIKLFMNTFELVALKYLTQYIISRQIIFNLIMISTQTKTQSYRQISGNQYEPINLAATGVKCLSCNQYYQPDQLERHLATHVNPYYIKNVPISTAQTPAKLRLASMLQQPEREEHIWVKSVLMQDMPRQQLDRKKVSGPSGHYAPLTTQIHKQNNLNRPDSIKDAWSLTSDTIQSVEQISKPLDIKANVKLSRSQNPIAKKQLHVYMNQNAGLANFDMITSKRKEAPDTQTEASDKDRGYAVHEGHYEQQPVRKLGQPKQQNRQTYFISSDRKNPGHHLNISTFSRHQLGKSGTRSPTTHIDQTSRHNNNNHECPCCGGFYCSYCKSSVPPIFRPVPDSEGNYHFHPQQYDKAVQFYRDHEYQRDVNICTYCERNYDDSKSMVNKYTQQSSPNHRLQNTRN